MVLSSLYDDYDHNYVAFPLRVDKDMAFKIRILSHTN